MKTVLFVPGFREGIKSRDYKSTINAIEQVGYDVTFIDIKWDRRTIEDWTAQLNAEYQKHDPQNIILAGFSFGAMTAFVCAAKQSPSELWLFSLSPYFKEDIESDTMEATWLKNIGKNRAATFSELRFKELAEDIECRTLLFVGQKEIEMWPDMKHRTYEAQKIIKKSQLHIVEETGHDVADSRYITTIVEAIK